MTDLAYSSESEPGAQSETSPKGSSSVEERLLGTLSALRRGAEGFEGRLEQELTTVHDVHRAGARNLVHYLWLRQRDLRSLQRELTTLGLSSLGRLETCVLITLQRVEAALTLLKGALPAVPGGPPFLDFGQGEEILRQNTTELLGPAPSGRRTRIMVTLGVDDSQEEVEALLRAGMNVARINCSKGSPGEWELLVQRVRSARESLGCACPIQFDLAGPNPRTRALGKLTGSARVGVGDQVALYADKKALKNGRKTQVTAADMGCSMPEVLPYLRVGQRCIYDDGRLVGRVVASSVDSVLVEIVQSAKATVKFRAEKGLNFPDSELPFPSLTEKDLADLDFVVQQGDIVGLSFVRSPEDVARLQTELGKRNAADLAVVVKVETVSAFRALGRVILTGMRSRVLGVMVARGDMAAELGFVRLAEAQEEVLWLGEAALVPVVWATQVLENLGNTGIPSRAEVTDAAMGGRAECIMLNRGPFLVESVRFLDDVLCRMQLHQEKKRSMLRRLQISEL